METYRKLLSVAAIAAIAFSVPVMAKAQWVSDSGGTNSQSGVSSFTLCTPGTLGCDSGNQRAREPRQNIPKGYDRRPPSGKIGVPTNRLPKVNPPQPQRLSCHQIIRILKRKRLYNIRPIYCQGSNYTYRASYRGKNYVVIVRSSDGEILSSSRI